MSVFVFKVFIFWMSFNEGVGISFGLGFKGDFKGGVIWIDGVFGGGVKFSGNNVDYVEVNNLGSVDLIVKFSLGGWFNMLGIVGVIWLVSKKGVIGLGMDGDKFFV